MWNVSLMVFIIVNKSQRNTKTNTALVFVSNIWPLCSMASLVQKHKVLKCFSSQTGENVFSWAYFQHSNNQFLVFQWVYIILVKCTVLYLSVS